MPRHRPPPPLVRHPNRGYPLPPPTASAVRIQKAPAQIKKRPRPRGGRCGGLGGAASARKVGKKYTHSIPHACVSCTIRWFPTPVGASMRPRGRHGDSGRVRPQSCGCGAPVRRVNLSINTTIQAPNPQVPTAAVRVVRVAHTKSTTSGYNAPQLACGALWVARTRHFRTESWKQIYAFHTARAHQLYHSLVSHTGQGVSAPPGASCRRSRAGQRRKVRSAGV